MKKILLILSMTPLFIKAQVETEFPQGNFEEMPSLKIRHLKGMHSIDVRYMYAHLGPAYELNYGYLMTDKAQFHAGLYYETGKLSFATFDYKNIKLGVSYTLFKIKQRVFLNADLSLLAGAINAKDSDLGIEDQYFNYGASGGLNAEIYLVNKISIILAADQQYNFKDKFGKWHYNLAAGLRFHLN